MVDSNIMVFCYEDDTPRIDSHADGHTDDNDCVEDFRRYGCQAGDKYMHHRIECYRTLYHLQVTKESQGVVRLCICGYLYDAGHRYDNGTIL